MTSFFASNSAFGKEFERCCKQYSNLEMYIAWIGDPQNVIPFEHLYSLRNIVAVIGVSFYQSHPDGIQLLMEIAKEVRIANNNTLFHPKVYIFSDGSKRAVFIGSSNFTYQGFYQNSEVNVLIEGDSDTKEISAFENDVRKWKSNQHSFVPDSRWLSNYAERFNKRRQKVKDARLDDEVEQDEKASGSISWLTSSNWAVYVKRIIGELKKSQDGFEDSLQRKLNLFKRCELELAFPWEVEYFSDIEKRRLIGGIEPSKSAPESYAWLGHVAASGDFRRMLANGTKHEHTTIVNAMNSISELSHPIDQKKLQTSLNKLVQLGPSMKVWGRLLAITRPDLFCTISAPHVRKNIAVELDKPERYFEDVEGYLMLIKLVHSSPWFNSTPPTHKDELAIWQNRVAFLDVVYY